jgi:hypothetical protein
MSSSLLGVPCHVAYAPPHCKEWHLKPQYVVVNAAVGRLDVYSDRSSWEVRWGFALAWVVPDP